MSNAAKVVGGIVALGALGVGGYLVYQAINKKPCDESFEGTCQVDDDGFCYCCEPVGESIEDMIFKLLNPDAEAYYKKGKASDCNGGGESCAGGMDCPTHCDGSALYYNGHCDPATGHCAYDIDNNSVTCMTPYPMQVRLTDNGVADPSTVIIQSINELWCAGGNLRPVEDTHEIKVLVLDQMQRPMPNIDVTCTITMPSGYHLVAWFTGAPSGGYVGNALNCGSIIAKTDASGVATAYITNIKNPGGIANGYLEFRAKDPRGTPPTYPGAYLRQALILSKGGMWSGPNTCVEYFLDVSGGCWQ